MKKLRWWIAGAIALALAAGAAFAAVELLGAREVPTAPSVYVPEAFESVRVSEGHQAHLALGSVRCENCHDMSDFGSTREGLCSECHAEARTTIHARGDTMFECTSCHEFRPEGVVPNDCVRCHGRVEDAPAVAMHSETRCVGCHEPHGELGARDCLECHAELRFEHGRLDGDSDCTSCHQGHELAETALDRCIACHAEGPHRVNATAALGRGHDRCTSCHAIHPDADQRGTARCTTCHANRQGSVLVAAHDGRCSNCHAAHAPEIPADRSCARCHEEVHSDHPAIASQTCSSCHLAHPSVSLAGQLVLGCSQGCHAEAPTETAFHAGQVRCVQCHAPHDFTISAARLCDRCHSTESREVTAGHTECTGCHEDAHRPAPRANACASCHATEHATAPQGHRECASCHEAHDGELVAGATCASCHATQARSEHGSARTPCASCHRPHGPNGVSTPPRCASCHTASLPGLHSLPDHRQCTDCHDAHEIEVSSDRAACTTACHQRMRDHEPEARDCAACHPFGR